MHEIIAGKYLEKIDGIDSFSILPKGGKNAYYITSDGYIIKGSELQDKAGAKSLDFYWIYKNIECYASHKYTKESVGNQDSQYKEKLEFLKKILIRTKGNIAFFSIYDGIYYNEKRMGELKSLTRDKKPFSFACHIQDVENILENYFV